MVGRSLGHYEIAELLGSGGMGEVYRAHDLSLKRDIAVKVLPDGLADDPDRLARLEREAHSLAALNHPNVATIHGLEEAGGVRFLVLELVEGETLAERLHGGALEVEEALGIAQQIAEGLEAAHGNGIVHRDLKPANIKITPEGRVKVLDFGLAKSIEGGGYEGAETDALTHSPTLTVAGTVAGVLLGTAPYMSPEQAKGKAVDNRTDIWAFGCVLYEMLTGRRPFVGEDVTDTIASILKVEPDWSLMPANTPALARSLVRRCLRKDPGRRLHDIADARIELEEALGEPAEALPPFDATLDEVAPSLWPQSLPWGLAAAALIVAAVSVVWSTTRETTMEAALPASRPSEWEIRLPGGEAVGFRLAISPDGSRIVSRSAGMLYLYRQSDGKFAPLHNTEGAGPPFFSPDGGWVGFLQDDKLRRISVTGGAPYDICDAPGGVSGATWATDGTIIFERDGGLARVPAFGPGEPVPIATPESSAGEVSYRLPQMLPGDDAVIYSVETAGIYSMDDAQIVVLDLDTGRRTILPEKGTAPTVTPTGHLVYLRNNALWAIEFDLDTYETRGQPVEVQQGIATLMQTTPAFALAGGTLAYVPGSPWVDPNLAWVEKQDGQQVETPAIEKIAAIGHVDLSPNRRLAALEVGLLNSDILIYDLERGEPLLPLTLERTQSFVTWIDDERFLVREEVGAGTWPYYSGSVDVERLDPFLVDLGEYDEIAPTSVSPDGAWLVAAALHPVTGWDLMRMPLQGEHVLQELLITNANEEGPEYSPDGNLIAYVTDFSGQNEIRILRASDPGSRPVSVGRGGYSGFRWGFDSDVLYYFQPGESGFANVLLAVSIGQDPELTVGEPTVAIDLARFTFPAAYYWDIGKDGRFLGWMDAEPYVPPSQIKVILNFFERLKELVPGGR